MYLSITPILCNYSATSFTSYDAPSIMNTMADA